VCEKKEDEACSSTINLSLIQSTWTLAVAVAFSCCCATMCRYAGMIPRLWGQKLDVHIHLADIHVEDKKVKLIRYNPLSIANLFGCFISLIHPTIHTPPKCKTYSDPMRNM